MNKFTTVKTRKKNNLEKIVTVHLVSDNVLSEK